MLPRLLCTLSLCAPVAAQQELFAYDTALEATIGSSHCDHFRPLGNGAVFSALVPGHGYSLWFTDGTDRGTRLVRAWPHSFELGPQSIDCVDPARPNYRYMTVHSRDHGHELWRTDGTPGGTQLVVDILPGRGGSEPSHLTPVAGRIVFLANDWVHGPELWVSDGTATGTRLLADVNSGQSGVRIWATATAEDGKTAWLTLEDQTDNLQLWRTDGTPNGTYQLTGPQPLRTTDRALVPLGSGLLFTGYLNGSAGIWRSDGTRGGMRLILSDASIGLGGAKIGNGTRSRVAFMTTHRGVSGIWSTDGTSAGTRSMLRFPAGWSPGLEFHGLSRSQLLFSAAPAPRADPRLFVTDGSAQGTVELANVRPYGITSVRTGICIFSGHTPGSRKFWVYSTDGTRAGTRRISDVFPVMRSSTRVGGSLLFGALGPLGMEPYVTDGTAQGTRLVRDLNPTTGTSNAVVDYTAVDGHVFIKKRSGGELWRGGVGGTRLLTNTKPGRLSDFAIFGSFFDGERARFLFAPANHHLGVEPWISDGTAGNTRPLGDIHPGTGSSNPHAFAGLRGSALFLASNGVRDEGAQLWRTDGGQPRLVAALGPIHYRATSDLVRWRGHVYFATSQGGVWQSDGTTTGTRLLLPPAPHFEVKELAPLGDRLAFVRQHSRHDQLWLTDGTRAGTVHLPTGNALHEIRELTCWGERIVFAGTTNLEGEEPWISDGTTAGTRLLRDLAPGNANGSPWGFSITHDRVYFASGPPRYELWSSDGTTVGTSVCAPSKSIGPVRAFEFGSISRGAAFSIGEPTPAIGFYDGNPDSARVLVRFPSHVAGPGGDFRVVDGRLLFQATTPEYGSEVHWIPLTLATTERRGQACGSSWPSLRGSPPRMGSTAQLEGRIFGGRPRGIVLLGSPTVRLQPLYPGSYCSTGIDFTRAVAVITAITTPTWRSQLAIPIHPRLLGQTVAAQVLSLDPGTNRLESSATLRLNLGH